MHKEWKKYRFKEVVNFQPSVKLVKDEIYPFIPMENIEAGTSYVHPVQSKVFEGSSCTKFKDKDIIFARITPCLQNGKITQVILGEDKVGFGSTEYFVFRAKEKYLDQQFLFYFVTSDSFIGSAINSMVGASGRQRADKGYIENLEIILPPLIYQKQIAKILSSLDNLIENNSKRITILEQMAEQIYKEWFVRMRFTGYESTKFVKGIPEGWRIKSLGELCYFNHNSLKKSNAPEKIRYVDISSVSTNRIDSFEEMNFSNAPSRAKRIVRHGDIIWSSVRPINRAYARIINPVENLIVSTGFVVITPREIPSEFIYYFTTSDEFVDHIASVAKGAAYPAASVDDFKKMLLVVPSPEILNRYTKIITPILSQIDILMNQSKLLKESRNLLLPRLISGKLSVQQAEKTLQDTL